MTPTELQRKFDELLLLPAETEWVEFKEAKTRFEFDDLGKYFSALSNEANLKGHQYGCEQGQNNDQPPEPADGCGTESSWMGCQPQAGATDHAGGQPAVCNQAQIRGRHNRLPSQLEGVSESGGRDGSDRGRSALGG